VTFGGGMWPEPDPNHKPTYHTFGEDVRDLLGLALRVLGWGFKIAGWLAAGALLVWAAVYLYAAAQTAPPWVWLIVAPLLGIWWQLSRRRERAP
jgi:hypothetical protein